MSVAADSRDAVSYVRLMQGHIRKRVHVAKSGKKSTRWYVVVALARRSDGKRRQKWHGGFATRAEAEVARASLVAGVYDGSYVEPSRLTVGEWVQGRWMAMMRSRVKPSTAAAYMSHINNHVLPAIGARRLQAVTTADLNTLYGAMLNNGRLDGKGGVAYATFTC